MVTYHEYIALDHRKGRTMTALVVVAHPDPESLTHHVGGLVAAALRSRGSTVRVADLHGERFDPRFSLADRHHYRGEGPIPEDVAAEHVRLDGVDDLVLVFPVYWWSMPALLKGWVDRVFINGWAYDDHVTPMARKLGGMTIHLVMIAGDDAESFGRRGYDTAIETQIVTGILGYCGAREGVTAVVHESEGRSRESIGLEIEEVAESVADRAATDRSSIGV